MLDQCCNSGDGQRGIRSQCACHILLEAHAKLRLAGGDERFRAILRRLLNGNLQAVIRKVAVFLGHVEACVVGVGRPIQHNGEFCFRLRARVFFILCAAGENGQNAGRGHQQREDTFCQFHQSHSPFLCFK